MGEMSFREYGGMIEREQSRESIDGFLPMRKLTPGSVFGTGNEEKALLA
jgi:hypothetical protein